MQVFVTGGTGQTGPAIVSELIAAGHEVTGLARSDGAVERLRGLGARSHRGSIEDLASLRAGASRADGVVHMAMGGDFSDPEDMTRREVAAISALGDALAGTEKPLISTSGTLVLRAGELGGEDSATDPGSIGSLRIEGEQTCLSFADRGVRAMVLRLAPTVHGPDDHGFIPMLIQTARDTGVSAYVGNGSNRWPAVNRLDAAILYRLALEHGQGGRVLHAIGENAIAFKSIAEKIAQQLAIETLSLTAEQSAEHYTNPFMARVYAADAPASSSLTQTALGWTPTHPGLLDDLDSGDYFA